MLDSVESVNFLRTATDAAPVRVCIDIDASLRVGPAHLGVRRSPLRTDSEIATVARYAERSGLHVAGVMFYEAQIAGLPDSSPAVRLVKKRSATELAHRRGRLVGTVQDAIGRPLEFVNAGGTGSLEVSGADPAVTEVTAGSGLYCPALFDQYDAFEARPAMYFGLSVVRRPAPGFVTLGGGGYIASGPVGKSRQPTIVTPGLKLLGTEGAGEVQTPVTGRTADSLALGDRVWLRYAKAGEMLERFDEVHLVDGDELVEVVPSYRGEGKNFG
jgi:D-serine deaminase-like pyridoxal phosphate-dependent protein